MNTNKRLKPNLLDPIIEKKIIKTLKPPKEDYWAPTKNTFQSFYQNYIKPNIALVVLIILFIIFLLYRYRTIKKNREQKETTNNNTNCNTNECYKYVEKTKEPDPKVKEYAEALVSVYNQQKEALREPKIGNFSSRMESAPKQPKLAYPMYPYKGGSLIPNASR